MALATHYMTKAWSLVSVNKDNEANQYLIKAERLYSKPPFKGLFLLEHKIMKGYILLKIKDYKKSFEILVIITLFH